jgi:hypothetical protein
MNNVKVWHFAAQLLSTHIARDVSRMPRALTFVGSEDNPIPVLHDAEHSQLDVGQIHPLTVHL